MKRAFGALSLLMGLGLGAWVGYNLFVERLPEAKGSPFMASLLSVGMVYCGIKWMRG